VKSLIISRKYIGCHRLHNYCIYVLFQFTGKLNYLYFPRFYAFPIIYVQFPLLDFSLLATSPVFPHFNSQYIHIPYACFSGGSVLYYLPEKYYIFEDMRDDQYVTDRDAQTHQVCLRSVRTLCHVLAELCSRSVFSLTEKGRIYGLKCEQNSSLEYARFSMIELSRPFLAPFTNIN